MSAERASYGIAKIFCLGKNFPKGNFAIKYAEKASFTHTAQKSLPPPCEKSVGTLPPGSIPFGFFPTLFLKKLT